MTFNGLGWQNGYVYITDYHTCAGKFWKWKKINFLSNVCYLLYSTLYTKIFPTTLYHMQERTSFYLVSLWDLWIEPHSLFQKKSNPSSTLGYIFSSLYLLFLRLLEVGFYFNSLLHYYYISVSLWILWLLRYNIFMSLLFVNDFFDRICKWLVV